MAPLFFQGAGGANYAFESKRQAARYVRVFGIHE